MPPKFVGVTGLPRAGSTLLCQLLAMHPEIQCEGHSSPLCNTLLGIRRMISDDQFFLAQLDNSFDSSYAHLSSAMQGFLRGWNQDCTKPVVVDKNRAWLHAIELLLHIEPEAKLVVCIRELGQVTAPSRRSTRRPFWWISSIIWPTSIVWGAQTCCLPRIRLSVRR